MNSNRYIKVLYFLLTNNCNSRCITCSYWKNKDKNSFKKKDILNIIKGFYECGLDTVIFSGGEPLLEKNIFSFSKEIKEKFPRLELRLLTNGLLLNKYAKEVSKHFDTVVVSLDADNSEIYKKIRGIEGFNIVVRGISHIRNLNKKIEIRLRCVIQKKNYKRIYNIIDLAKNLKADKISFLPADVQSKNSFKRVSGEKINKEDMVLNREENEEFKLIIKNIISSADKNKILFHEGVDLLKIYRYYSILNKGSQFPKMRCNVPNFSLIVDNNLDLYPCFFTEKITGANKINNILDVFEDKKFKKMKKNIFKNSIQCKRCVSPEFLNLNYL